MVFTMVLVVMGMQESLLLMFAIVLCGFFFIAVGKTTVGICVKGGTVLMVLLVLHSVGGSVADGFFSVFNKD